MPPPAVRPKPKRPNEIEISPAVMEKKAEDKSSPQKTINGLRQQTTQSTEDIRQVALLNPEDTKNRY